MSLYVYGYTKRVSLYVCYTRVTDIAACVSVPTDLYHLWHSSRFIGICEICRYRGRESPFIPSLRLHPIGFAHRPIGDTMWYHDPKMTISFRYALTALSHTVTPITGCHLWNASTTTKYLRSSFEASSLLLRCSATTQLFAQLCGDSPSLVLRNSFAVPPKSPILITNGAPQNRGSAHSYTCCQICLCHLYSLQFAYNQIIKLTKTNISYKLQ